MRNGKRRSVPPFICFLRSFVILRCVLRLSVCARAHLAAYLSAHTPAQKAHSTHKKREEERKEKERRKIDVFRV
jgi:hypothetical protein